MHIEPGLVDGAKIVLSYATATTALGVAAKMAWDTVRNDGGVPAIVSRTIVTTLLTIAFFTVAPHYPVGPSEIHFILGATLFLMFGAGAASLGLALGLLAQAVLLEPMDLPQYGMNVTSLLVPLWGVAALAKRLIAPGTAYVDLTYKQTLALSAAYQAGVVSWVAFWVIYGQGLGAETLASLGAFGASYLVVVALEPALDMAVLFGAKTWRNLTENDLFTARLHHAA